MRITSYLRDVSYLSFTNMNDSIMTGKIVGLLTDIGYEATKYFPDLLTVGLSEYLFSCSYGEWGRSLSLYQSPYLRGHGIIPFLKRRLLTIEAIKPGSNSLACYLYDRKLWRIVKNNLNNFAYFNNIIYVHLHLEDDNYSNYELMIEGKTDHGENDFVYV